MIISTLTSKAQTTIPQAVRNALGLRPGDALAYAIENGRAILTRAESPQLTDDPFATFSEWHSDADAAAYDRL
jgi:antitoxin PrlF